MTAARIRLGIAGLGFGTNLTLPDILRHSGYVITAGADPRPAARDAFTRAFGAAAYATVAELCASPDVDLVYVCTPAYLHAEQAVLAAEHGKHVLVEKPMALSAEECGRMLRAAQARRVKLFYGHTHSYDPPIRAMRRLIASGVYGSVRMISMLTYTDLLYRARAEWEMDTAKGGGVVYIQAPHQIDIARYLADAPVFSVQAGTFMLDPARPTEGAYSAHLRFANGAVAALSYSGYGRFDSAELHHWVGEDGHPRDPATHADTVAAFRGRRDEPSAREARRFGIAMPDPAEPPGHQTFGFLLVGLERADLRQSPRGIFVHADGAVREEQVPLSPSGRTLMLDEIHASLTRDAPPSHDGAWGCATVAVCEAMLASSKAGAPVGLGRPAALRENVPT